MGAYTDKPYGALMLDELEDYQEVIASLSAHIERGVSIGAALHNRGLAHWEIGEPDQALRDFDEALEQIVFERCKVCPLCEAIVDHDGPVVNREPSDPSLATILEDKDRWLCRGYHDGSCEGLSSECSS